MPRRYALGDRVVITRASLQRIADGHQSIHAYPCDRYLAVATGLLGKAGIVTRLFPPGYEVNVTWGEEILQVKDHWVEPLKG